MYFCGPLKFSRGPLVVHGLPNCDLLSISSIRKQTICICYVRSKSFFVFLTKVQVLVVVTVDTDKAPAIEAPLATPLRRPCTDAQKRKFSFNAKRPVIIK